MAEHVAVQQPASWVVKHADDVTALKSIDQCRVAQVTQGTVLMNLIEVVAVQVDAVRERCIIRQSYPHRLSLLE